VTAKAGPSVISAVSIGQHTGRGSTQGCRAGRAVANNRMVRERCRRNWQSNASVARPCRSALRRRWSVSVAPEHPPGHRRDQVGAVSWAYVIPATAGIESSSSSRLRPLRASVPRHDNTAERAVGIQTLRSFQERPWWAEWAAMNRRGTRTPTRNHRFRSDRKPDRCK